VKSKFKCEQKSLSFQYGQCVLLVQRCRRQRILNVSATCHFSRSMFHFLWHW